MKIKSAEVVAASIILNILRYSVEKKRELTRHALTVTNIANKFGYVDGIIPHVAIQQLEFELRQRSYLLLQMNHNTFGLMKVSAMQNWPRISLDRVADVDLSDVSYLDDESHKLAAHVKSFSKSKIEDHEDFSVE